MGVKVLDEDEVSWEGGGGGGAESKSPKSSSSSSSKMLEVVALEMGGGGGGKAKDVDPLEKGLVELGRAGGGANGAMIGAAGPVDARTCGTGAGPGGGSGLARRGMMGAAVLVRGRVEDASGLETLGVAMKSSHMSNDDDAAAAAGGGAGAAVVDDPPPKSRKSSSLNAAGAGGGGALGDLEGGLDPRRGGGSSFWGSGVRYMSCPFLPIPRNPSSPSNPSRPPSSSPMRSPSPPERVVVGPWTSSRKSKSFPDSSSSFGVPSAFVTDVTSVVGFLDHRPKKRATPDGATGSVV